MTTDGQITIVKGDSRRKVLIVTNLIYTPNKAWFYVKKNKADADALAIVQKIITTTPSSAGVISYSSRYKQGTFTFDIDVATSKLLDLGNWFYDIQFRVTSGGIYTPEMGSFAVVEGVTITDA